MSEEIVREWNFWLVSIATGAFMAFVYDLVRLFRRIIRHNRLAVDLEDILYWTACFGLSFTLLYYGNNGVIRFAAVLGAAIGMLGYAVTVGRFFVRVSYLVIDRTVGSMFRLLRKIMGKIRKLLKPIACFAVNNYHKLKRLFIRLFQKIRLTCAANRHRMKVHSCKDAKSGKGETTDGRSAKKKKRRKKHKKIKEKDTRVSQGEK